MVEVLEGIERDSEQYKKVIRPERFITPRAYLQHIAGSSSEAK